MSTPNTDTINTTMKLCECGCGRHVKKSVRFRHGHNRRGLPRPEATKQRISAQIVKYLQPDEVSPDLRHCLDFDSQILKPRNDGRMHLHIRRICRGCGDVILTRVSNIRQGRIKPDCVSCIVKTLIGTNNAHWKGGKWFTGEGYVKVHTPWHPRNIGGYVLEHRLVMERMIGRYLEPNETIHHRDGNRANNIEENLELWIGNHGSGIRVSDMKHCETCQCMVIRTPKP